MKNWHHKKEPWKPSEYDEQVLYAVRAFRAGIANEGQQMLVWDWLMFVSGVTDLPFRPGGLEGQRDTDFASGKAFVGHQFNKMLTVDALHGLHKQAEKDKTRETRLRDDKHG